MKFNATHHCPGRSRVMVKYRDDDRVFVQFAGGGHNHFDTDYFEEWYEPVPSKYVPMVGDLFTIKTAAHLFDSVFRRVNACTGIGDERYDNSLNCEWVYCDPQYSESILPGSTCSISFDCDDSEYVKMKEVITYVPD